MQRIRFEYLAACLFLAAAPLSGQEQAVMMPARPKLPHTKEERWPMKRLKLDHSVVIYDSWKPSRKVIRRADRGTVVQGLRRVSVVYAPDYHDHRSDAAARLGRWRHNLPLYRRR
jgi:predicted metal-dependent hydrolase